MSLFTTKSLPIIDGLNIGSDRNSTTSSSDSFSPNICSSNFGLGFDNCFSIFRQTEPSYCISNGLTNCYDYYELDSSDESYNQKSVVDCSSQKRPVRSTRAVFPRLEYSKMSQPVSKRSYKKVRKCATSVSPHTVSSPTPSSRYSKRIASTSKFFDSTVAESYSTAPFTDSVRAVAVVNSPELDVTPASHPSLPPAIQQVLCTSPNPIPISPSNAETASLRPFNESPIDLSCNVNTSPQTPHSDASSLNNVYSRLRHLYPLSNASLENNKKSLVFWKKLILKDSSYRYFDLCNNANATVLNKNNVSSVNSLNTICSDSHNQQSSRVDNNILSPESPTPESQSPPESLLTSIFNNHPTLLTTPKNSKLKIIDLAQNYTKHSPFSPTDSQQNLMEQKVPRKKRESKSKSRVVVKCSCGDAEIASVRSLNSSISSCSDSDVESKDSCHGPSSTIHSYNDEVASSVPTVGQDIVYHTSESDADKDSHFIKKEDIKVNCHLSENDNCLNQEKSLHIARYSDNSNHSLHAQNRLSDSSEVVHSAEDSSRSKKVPKMYYSNLASTSKVDESDDGDKDSDTNDSNSCNESDSSSSESDNSDSGQSPPAKTACHLKMLSKKYKDKYPKQVNRGNYYKSLLSNRTSKHNVAHNESSSSSENSSSGHSSDSSESNSSSSSEESTVNKKLKKSIHLKRANAIERISFQKMRLMKHRQIIKDVQLHLLPQKKSLLRLYDLEQKLSTKGLSNRTKVANISSRTTKRSYSSNSSSSVKSTKRNKLKTVNETLFTNVDSESKENQSMEKIIQNDEELARRLQQEEYFAARPARRRVAMLAYDRLHEQIIGGKKESTEVDKRKRKKSVDDHATTSFQQETNFEPHLDDELKSTKKLRLANSLR